MRNSNYIREAETTSVYGDRIVLYYFANEKKINTSDGEVTKYGVGIIMYTQMPNQRTRRERKDAEGIFSTKREAEEFADILCRGLVTPVSLDDIVADKVG